MKLTPNRRWFQFSLRTLFLLTAVFGIWLGWQIRVVHARKALLHEARVYDGQWGPTLRYQVCGFTGDCMELEREISWFRELLGDEEIGHVKVAKGTPQQFTERLKNTFPGAQIVVDSPNPLEGGDFQL